MKEAERSIGLLMSTCQCIVCMLWMWCIVTVVCAIVVMPLLSTHFSIFRSSIYWDVHSQHPTQVRHSYVNGYVCIKLHFT